MLRISSLAAVPLVAALAEEECRDLIDSDLCAKHTDCCTNAECREGENGMVTYDTQRANCAFTCGICADATTEGMNADWWDRIKEAKDKREEAKKAEEEAQAELERLEKLKAEQAEREKEEAAAHSHDDHHDHHVVDKPVHHDPEHQAFDTDNKHTIIMGEQKEDVQDTGFKPPPKREVERESDWELHKRQKELEDELEAARKKQQDAEKEQERLKEEEEEIQKILVKEQEEKEEHDRAAADQKKDGPSEEEKEGSWFMFLLAVNILLVILAVLWYKRKHGYICRRKDESEYAMLESGHQEMGMMGLAE